VHCSSEASQGNSSTSLRDKFHRAPEWVADTDRRWRVITRFVQAADASPMIEYTHTSDSRPVLDGIINRTESIRQRAQRKMEWNDAKLHPVVISVVWRKRESGCTAHEASRQAPHYRV
jgi:hypothetical protein